MDAASLQADTRRALDFARLYEPPRIEGNFTGNHILTVEQFSRQDLQDLFDASTSLKKRSRQHDRGMTEICSGKVMAMIFFEARTRTDMSFQAAMRRLGGEVIGASNGVRFSSVYKGENLADREHALAAQALLQEAEDAVEVIGCGGILDGASWRACATRAAQYWSALVWRGPLAAALILHEEQHGPW